MDVLVIAEDNRGSIHRLSLEAIAGAQKLAENVGVLLLGSNAKKQASELMNYNLSHLLTIENSKVASYNADGYSEVISQVIDNESPKIIIAGHTYQTRDFMPRVSAKLDMPFIPDITSLKGDGFVKQVLNAKLNAMITSSSNSIILSFQSASFSEEEIQPGACEIFPYDDKISDFEVRTTSEEAFLEEAGDVDLESADVLISVGRGMEKKENLPIAFDLAKVLGGEVSASRPVVDSDWVESFRQVGSSGSNVAPKLYFSLGISGAIQHVVGMKGSKKILAINKDKDAPIFEISDYAVIGDVLEILPKLVEELKKKN